MTRMLRTTVYLPLELKERLSYTARLRRVSEAELIRLAIRAATFPLDPPKPRLPPFEPGDVDPTIAERDEEILDIELGRD